MKQLFSILFLFVCAFSKAQTLPLNFTQTPYCKGDTQIFLQEKFVNGKLTSLGFFRDTVFLGFNKPAGYTSATLVKDTTVSARLDFSNALQSVGNLNLQNIENNTGNSQAYLSNIQTTNLAMVKTYSANVQIPNNTGLQTQGDIVDIILQDDKQDYAVIRFDGGTGFFDLDCYGEDVNGNQFLLKHNISVQSITNLSFLVKISTFGFQNIHIRLNQANGISVSVKSGYSVANDPFNEEFIAEQKTGNNNKQILDYGLLWQSSGDKVNQDKDFLEIEIYNYGATPVIIEENGNSVLGMNNQGGVIYTQIQPNTSKIWKAIYDERKKVYTKLPYFIIATNPANIQIMLTPFQ